MKLLLATTNPAKRGDMEAVLSALALDFVSLADLDPQFDVAETGETFAENAILKARAAAERFRLPAIADDGGLEIDGLGGAPGVYSKRWLGDDVDEEGLIAGTLEKCKALSAKERKARFRTVIAFATPDGSVVTEEGAAEGVIPIAAYPKRTKGYPYRSIFWLSDLGKYAVELTDEEVKAHLNHRHQALTNLLPKIQEYFAHVK